MNKKSRYFKDKEIKCAVHCSLFFTVVNRLNLPGSDIPTTIFVHNLLILGKHIAIFKKGEDSVK
jgi:hypothetical protein